jgi:hypothetical protein
VAAGALDKFVELAKGLGTAVAAAAPLFAVTPVLNTIFPFLNEKIIGDSWGISLLAMAVAGLFTYFFSMPELPAPAPKPKWPGIISVIVFFLSLGLLLALTFLRTPVFEIGPEWQPFLARFSFVGVFVGVAGTIGSVFGWMLNQ